MKRYGPFPISLKNIWIKNGKAKVWISEDPFTNYKIAIDEEIMV